VHKLAINFGEIVSRARGKFEEQSNVLVLSKILSVTALLLLMHIIIILYNYYIVLYYITREVSSRNAIRKKNFGSNWGCCYFLV